MEAATLQRLINYWPPFFFSGIRATKIQPDFSAVEVRLKLRWSNRTLLGAQYGGNLYAMTDAWYGMMIMYRLGKGYQVWDQRASIDFIAPARTDVYATFRLDDNAVESIRERTSTGEKFLPEFEVEVVDTNNVVVARISKTVYVRQRQKEVGR